MIKVLIINGVARSGKDTFVDAIKSHPSVTILTKYSTIDDVKSIAAQMGCDPEVKSDKNRKFWSDIKCLWTEYNDGIFKKITKGIDETFKNNNLRSDCLDVATVMCREPKEIQKFVNYYGTRNCVTILVERPGLIISENMADQGVSDFCYDHIVANDGDLEKLDQLAYELIGAITYKK